MTPKSQPRETSPLLPKPTNTTAQWNALSNDVVPETADAPLRDEDVERQSVNDDSVQHQGLPEVRKRMKYIFPALAIGVSTPSVHLKRTLSLTTSTRSS